MSIKISKRKPRVARDFARMSNGEILKIKKQNDKESSKLVDALIKQGRGTEKFSDTSKRVKIDRVARRYVQITNESRAISNEVERRTGDRHGIMFLSRPGGARIKSGSRFTK